MGLRISRKAKPRTGSCPESITLQSAIHNHTRLVRNERCPVSVTNVIEFADEQDDLDRNAVKRLFDHVWNETKSDKRSNVLLKLAKVRAVDPLFRTELMYLSRQLRQQRKEVRLSCVNLEGDWTDWL